MARGGRRAGAPGKNYSNRTDLNQNRRLPVQTVPGQGYGEAAAQREAQRLVPRASGAINQAPAAPSMAAPAAPPAQTPAPQLSDVMAQAQNFNPPPVVPLSAPTGRPGEPLMTPPSPTVNPNPLLSSVALLNSLGADASPAVKALRASLGAAQANAAAP